MNWNITHHHHHDDPDVASLLRAILHKLDKLDVLNTKLETIMSALDNLAKDIGDLITEAVTDITAAVAAAQAASNDPAIDALDAKVKATTQTLKDEAAKLATPVVVTPPVVVPPVAPASPPV